MVERLCIEGTLSMSCNNRPLLLLASVFGGVSSARLLPEHNPSRLNGFNFFSQHLTVFVRDLSNIATA